MITYRQLEYGKFACSECHVVVADADRAAHTEYCEALRDILDRLLDRTRS